MNRTKSGHPLNWKRARSQRKLRQALPLQSFNFPIDLRPYDTPIQNQARESSCTAFAGCGAFKFLWKENKKILFDASEQFLYATERIIDGDLNEDQGSSLHTSALAFQQYGVCTTDQWPYITADEFQYPPSNVFQEALPQRISGYKLLNTPNDFLTCLANGSPFVFGIDVYSNFDQTGSNGIINYPSQSDVYEGGHALCCVGAFLMNGVLYYIVRNSWGISFGDAGYCYISSEYVHSSLCDEFIQFLLTPEVTE